MVVAIVFAYVNSGTCISTKNLEAMALPYRLTHHSFFSGVNLILLERDTRFSPPINMFIEMSFVYVLSVSKLIFLALYGLVSFSYNCFMTKVLLLFLILQYCHSDANIKHGLSYKWLTSYCTEIVFCILYS